MRSLTAKVRPESGPSAVGAIEKHSTNARESSIETYLPAGGMRFPLNVVIALREMVAGPGSHNVPVVPPKDMHLARSQCLHIYRRAEIGCGAAGRSGAWM